MVSVRVLGVWWYLPQDTGGMRRLRMPLAYANRRSTVKSVRFGWSANLGSPLPVLTMARSLFKRSYAYTHPSHHTCTLNKSVLLDLELQTSSLERGT